MSADGPWLLRVVGSVLFALIGLGTASAATPAALSPEPAVRPFAWGINGHPFTQVGYLDVSIPRQLDLDAELGAGWYRFDCSAEEFRRNTVRFDVLLAEAERRHLHLLPVLFSSPGGRSESATPARIREAARTFARDIVGRYKGRITHWELSNELDTAAMIRKGETTRSGKLWVWGDADGSSPDDFHEGRYQKAKAEIAGLQEGVKAADPGAITIVDTAGWLHYGFIERLVREDHVPFDVLAWHWYSEMGDITKVRGKLDLLNLLGGYGKPLWITEINRRDGSRGGNEQEQASYLGRTAAQMAARPDVGAFFVYELLDEPYFGATNPESHYGLVELAQDANKTWRVARKKAAFDVYRAAIRAAGTSAR